LAFSKSAVAPFTNDYEVNTFIANAQGKYSGQSIGLIKSVNNTSAKDYKHLILIDNDTKDVVLLDNL